MPHLYPASQGRKPGFGVDPARSGYVALMTNIKQITLTDMLIDLERNGWTALCDGTGSDFYGSMMTDDALMVLANGQVMTRDNVVDALQDAPTWHSFTIDDPRAVWTGEDSVALVYRTTASRDDGSPDFEGLMTTVYFFDGTRWTITLHQQTPIPQPS